MFAQSTIDTRLRPFEAVKAVRRLLANPEATEEVFVILRAMRGRSGITLFRRFAQSPHPRSGTHLSYGTRPDFRILRFDQVVHDVRWNDTLNRVTFTHSVLPFFGFPRVSYSLPSIY